MINIPLSLRAQGRFKLIKHSGHKFDENGKVLEWGKVLDETPFSDNVFTNAGRTAYLSAGGVPLTAILSTSSIPPTVSTISIPATRSSSTLIDVFVTRQNVPDDAGLIHWRITYRFTFPSVALGAGVRFRQAAITSGAFGTVSASLLKDQVGNPSSVFVDQSEEAVDLVWEFNEYIPHETSGTIEARYVKGGSVINTSTHAWVLRPANFTNVSDIYKGWGEILTNQLPHITLDTDYVLAGNGEFGFAETEPTFVESFEAESVNVVTARWGFDATPIYGVSIVQFFLGHMEWQISFDPPLPKATRHTLDVTLNIAITNRG